jgi:hypothetical protein
MWENLGGYKEHTSGAGMGVPLLRAKVFKPILVAMLLGVTSCSNRGPDPPKPNAVKTEKTMWPALPTSGFVSGRAATKEDIAKGDAAFILPGGRAEAMKVVIPSTHTTSMGKRVSVARGSSFRRSAAPMGRSCWPCNRLTAAAPSSHFLPSTGCWVTFPRKRTEPNMGGCESNRVRSSPTGVCEPPPTRLRSLDRRPRWRRTRWRLSAENVTSPFAAESSSASFPRSKTPSPSRQRRCPTPRCRRRQPPSPCRRRFPQAVVRFRRQKRLAVPAPRSIRVALAGSGTGPT